jgi:fermentation-respiration switch protein FrsA (DUF1100 family)
MKRFRQIIFRAGVLIVIVYLGATGLLWWNQDALLFKPTSHYRSLPSSHGLSYEDVDLEVAMGTKIRGWFVRSLTEARGTILYFHGNGGNLSYEIETIHRFAEEGFDSFSIDYEGYGASDGTPSEANLYRDADAAWEWLTQAKGIDPRQVVIWGHSLGGGVATWVASRHPPRMVVLQNTFTDIPDMGARLYPWLPVRLVANNVFSNRDRIVAFRSPLVIAHGRNDELIPFEMGKDLFDAASEPKRFIELDGGHRDGFLNTPRAWTEVSEFWKQHP